MLPSCLWSTLFLFGPLKYLEIPVTKKNIIGRGAIAMMVSLVLDKGGQGPREYSNRSDQNMLSR